MTGSSSFDDIVAWRPIATATAVRSRPLLLPSFDDRNYAGSHTVSLLAVAVA